MNELNLNLPYFYGNEKDTFLFCKFPKAFFTDDRFKKMSSDAKILYTFMLDRVGISIASNWRDNDGRVYIICTNQEACDLLQKSKKTITNAMNELGEENFGLIERKKQGLGKADLIFVKNVDFLTKEREVNGAGGMENGKETKKETPSKSNANKGKTKGTQKKTKENISETYVENYVDKSVENFCQVENVLPQGGNIYSSGVGNFPPPEEQNFPPIKTDITNNENNKNDLLRPTLPPSPNETFPQSAPTTFFARLDDWRVLSREDKCSIIESELERAYHEGTDSLTSLLYSYRKVEEEMEIALYVLMEMGEADYMSQHYEQYSSELLSYRTRKLYSTALLQMLTTKELTKVRGAMISYAKVIEKLVPHIRQSPYSFNMEINNIVCCTVMAYLEANRETTINSPLPYMKSCIWTTLLEGAIRDEAEFHRCFG